MVCDPIAKIFSSLPVPLTLYKGVQKEQIQTAIKLLSQVLNLPHSNKNVIFQSMFLLEKFPIHFLSRFYFLLNIFPYRCVSSMDGLLHLPQHLERRGTQGQLTAVCGGICIHSVCTETSIWSCMQNVGYGATAGPPMGRLRGKTSVRTCLKNKI